MDNISGDVNLVTLPLSDDNPGGFAPAALDPMYKFGDLRACLGQFELRIQQDLIIF